MKSAVTVSLVPQVKGGPFVFWEGLDDAFARAASFGFDAVEIFPHPSEPLDVDEVRQLCARHRLAVAAVGTGGGWVVNKLHLCHADASIRAQARSFINTIIDVAAELNAPAIVGSMQGRVEGDVSREQAFVWLGEALRELGNHAADRNQVLLYEPLNRYETNLFNHLATASAFLDEVDAPAVKLLADLFHMNIEERSIPLALREAGARVAHVHFADSNRRAVGLGHTDVAPIIAALREVGYTGYLSAEVFALPDSATAARQTIDSFRRCTAAA